MVAAAAGRGAAGAERAGRRRDGRGPRGDREGGRGGGGTRSQEVTGRGRDPRLGEDREDAGGT